MRARGLHVTRPPHTPGHRAVPRPTFAPQSPSAAQHTVTGTTPLANLSAHLASPWSSTGERFDGLGVPGAFWREKRAKKRIG